MTDKIIKQIPDILQDPMVGLDSLSKPGRPILLGNVMGEKNRPVLVALELSPTDWKKKIINDEIKVASAYVKDRPQYLLNHSKYYYVNDNIKKTRDWLKRTKLQLPLGESQYGLIDTIISTSGEESNRNLRYSLKDEEGTSLYNSKEDDFAWMEDILKEEPGIKETASILQEGTEALQKAKKAPDSAAVRKISKSILEDIGSQYDLDTFSDNLEKVFSYMQSEDNVSYDDMVRVMTEVAWHELVVARREKDPVDIAYREKKNIVKRTLICYNRPKHKSNTFFNAKGFQALSKFLILSLELYAFYSLSKQEF